MHSQRISLWMLEGSLRANQQSRHVASVKSSVHGPWVALPRADNDDTCTAIRGVSLSHYVRLPHCSYRLRCLLALKPEKCHLHWAIVWQFICTCRGIEKVSRVLVEGYATWYRRFVWEFIGCTCIDISVQLSVTFAKMRRARIGSQCCGVAIWAGIGNTLLKKGFCSWQSYIKSDVTNCDSALPETFLWSLWLSFLWAKFLVHFPGVRFFRARFNLPNCP